MRRSLGLVAALALHLLFGGPGIARAAEAEACRAVRFADVGWTDITATTALAKRILRALGYELQSRLLSVPDAYEAMKNREVDVFLGNWMPTMEADRKPYVESGTVVVVGTNLDGAKFTLAVPSELYDAGLKSFADIARFRDRLQGRIYGIEPGNDGNRLIQGMIETNKFGLKGFELVESSEQGMLAEVEWAVRRKQPILFLGWEPHPMNVKFSIRYLEGGDAVFGPNLGGSTVYTNARAGFGAECPNAAAFIKNLKFNLALQNTVMSLILFGGLDPETAAELWLKVNADAWIPWVQGVTARDGSPAIPAVRQSLGLR
jgi:glycine betaine/proline transport system substrate-binding protein